MGTDAGAETGPYGIVAEELGQPLPAGGRGAAVHRALPEAGRLGAAAGGRRRDRARDRVGGVRPAAVEVDESRQAGKPAELPVHDRHQPGPRPLAQDGAGAPRLQQGGRGHRPRAVLRPGRRTSTCANCSRRCPTRLREPFLLHYYAGFGIKEIAAQLKRPEGTIKADLYHARARLKEALAERMTGPRIGGRRGAGTDGRKRRGGGGPMPANDERDPLDRWLDQQVRPLPPPPGTFELVTGGRAAARCASSRSPSRPPPRWWPRRYRHPAAALADVTPTPLAASAAAVSSSPTASGGEQPNGTATRYSPERADGRRPRLAAPRA